jgi:hypothetical protein
MVKLPLFLLAIASLGALAACEETVAVDCSPFQGRYMELTPGRTWTYRVTDQNGVRAKSQTVGSLEDVGGMKAGTMAYRVTTTKAGGTVVSWQEDLGDAIRRHREQDLAGTNMTDEFYDEFRTRISEKPEHLVEGATWDETFVEFITITSANPPVVQDPVMKTWRWTVTGVDVPTRVPAGDFCALRVTRDTIDGGMGTGEDAAKIFYFTRGVGKIKEYADGEDQVEELVSFTE